VVVEIQGDSIAHGGDTVSASVDEIHKRGIGCSIPALDESGMYNTVECGTGEVIREQAVGWAMYADEQWGS
jgi:hypothetical protein